jgi:hypothetical protein
MYKHSMFNVGADIYKMWRQKTIQWGGENVYLGADKKILKGAV